jgi:hypothetical protein
MNLLLSGDPLETHPIRRDLLGTRLIRRNLSYINHTELANILLVRIVQSRESVADFPRFSS